MPDSTPGPVPSGQPYRRIGRIRAIALALFGPADSPDHPFTGTRYDPRLKQLRQQARRFRRIDRRRIAPGH